ncbi:MAG TPA: tRNA lysidine(34) synthetase TilS [Rubrivivax sp.]
MPGRIAVAASGGRDSTALLHATARAARGFGLEVHALHVDHGLMPQAAGWAAHLRRQCQRWRRAGLPVEMHVTPLEGRPQPGDSTEAWARRERYRALASMAESLGIDLVLLAHHRGDQAETLLLQALRGAGAAGLAAMPAAAQRGGIHWLRPWLEQPRSAIEAYVRRHRLGYVDDDSNADPRFARNRLRLSVWPVLTAAFPEAEASLAHAARRAHEAAACAAELAAIDAAVCIDTQRRLHVGDWLKLDPQRRANLLRHWLGGALVDGVPDSLIERLQRELTAARLARQRPASWPAGAGSVRLHRGLLVCTVDTPQHACPPSCRLDLSRPGSYPLPAWGGSLIVAATQGQGIPSRLLAQAELRPREGAEQFQRTARSAPRSLKKQYQAAGVAPWQRGGPLVFAGDQLLFVPGLGVDGRVDRRDQEPTSSLHWQPGTGS